jgi:hypothetical protein
MTNFGVQEYYPSDMVDMSMFSFTSHTRYPLRNPKPITYVSKLLEMFHIKLVEKK